MKIKKITEVEPRRVYAIKTSSNTFIADGLAHHNCMACNMYKKGNYNVYAEKLIKEKGADFISEINKRTKSIEKVDRNWWQEKIDKYKELVESMDNYER